MAHLGRKAARKRAYRPQHSGEPQGSAHFTDSVTLPSRSGKTKAALADKYGDTTDSILPAHFGVRENGHHAPRLLGAGGVPIHKLKSLNLGASNAYSPPFQNSIETDANISTGSDIEVKAVLDVAGTTSSRVSPTGSAGWVAEDDLSFLELHIRKNRFPFLKRNLRVGFEARFSQSNKRSGWFSPMHIVFSQQEEDIGRPDEIPWKFTQLFDSLACPFCILFEPFTTITRLIRHIEWDHMNYSVSWKKVQ